MRVYLDNCCFNRPFDDQAMVGVRIESEAKIYVQEMIRGGRLELVWSYLLDYENSENPFEERRTAILEWKMISGRDIDEIPGVLEKAVELAEKGIKPKDAIHVSCAIMAQCDYFLTTDDALLRKALIVTEVKIVDPPSFIREVNP